MTTASGLSLAPMRGLRFDADGDTLARRLSPPYDVISGEVRAELVASDPYNVVRLILPEAPDGSDRYRHAAELLDSWVGDGVLEVEPSETLYVYEMRTAGNDVTRGLLGAVELRDPDDGVILPHENTMAGPVSDRLALMTATEADLEPIYLVYDGGGAASRAVADVSGRPPLVSTRTADGITHTLWGLGPETDLDAVATDLAGRTALIADGHHRYATYRQRQAQHGGVPGPWDRGLTFLVDTSEYGPQVHAIHRVIDIDFAAAVAGLAGKAQVSAPGTVDDAVAERDAHDGFAVVLARSAEEAVVVSDLDPAVLAAGFGDESGTPVSALDVSVVHRVLVGTVWGLPDTEDAVRYAHSVDEALADAGATGGTAILLAPTPVRAVADVAAAGLRMPRKSTLFTPKPASGLVLRRLSDQTA